ncbi:hypothetical protein K439DRAFT_1629800 [Ramaria rubella]|nr:hypothetical protein K439DRAFT_1629800 [Ramaria rubella]
MKFATTSSLLFATMALSPSLAAAAPTGIETPSSPNPAATPTIRQFPSSPLFNGHSPSVNHAPAFRTGPGSPRRRIPSRLSRVKRDPSPQDLTSSSSILNGVLQPLKSLPILGSLLGALGNSGDGSPGKGKVTDAAITPESIAQHASAASNLDLPFGIDQNTLLDGLPLTGATRGALSGITGSLDGVTGSLGGVTGSLPKDPQQIASGALTGLKGSLNGVVGGHIPLPINPGQGQRPASGAVSILPLGGGREIIQLADGTLIEKVNGALKVLPFDQVEHLGRLLAAEAVPSPAAPSAAHPTNISNPPTGLPAHPLHPAAPSLPTGAHPSENAAEARSATVPNPSPASQLPVHPPQSAGSAAAISPSLPASKLPVPAHPSSSGAPSPPAVIPRALSSNDATAAEIEELDPTVSSKDVDPANVPLPDDESDRDLIHGMSAP